MSPALFSLQEDLHALTEVLPTVSCEKQLGMYLQQIQTAPSREHLQILMERVKGYLQALDDLEAVNPEQSTLMREIVTRARLRCPLN